VITPAETDAVTLPAATLKESGPVTSVLEQPVFDPALVPLVDIGGSVPGSGPNQPNDKLQKEL
jgi:hypothetical protein